MNPNKNYEMEKARRLKGLTQKQLAAKMETSRMYITQIENGYASPSLTMAKRIAEELEVKVDDLF